MHRLSLSFYALDIVAPLLDFLRGRNGVRLIGQAQAQGRHPAVSFTCAKDPMDVATELGRRGIIAGAGHFYAYRLIEALGIDPQAGVVRLSAVHYNSAEDIAATCEALEAVL
ncbi:MAG: aminotransferase class V-fold PLP-dependent enzyme [Proteobacteria bacterium]|nr:aminotransferase class V-fold PLP-dependent enzyme [Pseudomonadota bacterium]